MEVRDNLQLDKLIITHLADKYKIREKREGRHLSTLVYCLTRGFLDNSIPPEPTDEEVMLFALGYGLQEVITPSQATTPTYSKDGITYRPDMLLDIPNFGLVEVKTTRKSMKNPEINESWLAYIKGGCYIRDTNSYDLSVLYMMGNYSPPFPKIKSCRLTFTQDELQSNWDYLVQRNDILNKCIEVKLPPEPCKFCYEWECSYCRHKTICQATVITGNFYKGE
jgi:hypothetical protein